MKRHARILIASLALAAPAEATWGIVLINHATREVGVACATCIQNIDLVPELPCVRPGLGVGNVQAWWDFNGSRRQTMWDGFGAGKSAEEVLYDLRELPQHYNYQFGIATFEGPPVTFTGTTAGDGKCGLTGSSGPWAWAIQGNLITGEPVCTAAQQAILDTPGDLAARLMAAMEAARSMGGDGRCSCDEFDPDSCGAPPPNFTKTAHTAFLIVARVGDVEGTCSPAGCADGGYYLKRNAIGNWNDQDPVLELADKVATWRNKQKGKPDHILSTVHADRQRLVADGKSRATVTVVLRDIDDVPLGHGGDTITVTQASPGAPTALAGPVTDHGDGSYSFDLVATGDAGRGSWELVVDFGGPKTRQLWPPLTLETSALTDLHTSHGSLSATGVEPLVVTHNRGPGELGRPYHLLLSAAGTWPGADLGGVHVPLNPDGLLLKSWRFPGPPCFPASKGALDADGRAEALVTMGSAEWGPVIGQRVHLVSLLGWPVQETTALAWVDIVP